MMAKFTGKVAIVTGSTDGIGLAIARRLAHDGAFVMVSSRKQNNVDRAVAMLRDEGLDVAGMVCHVGNSEHRERLIQETVKAKGGVDILVCSAGVNDRGHHTESANKEDWGARRLLWGGFLPGVSGCSLYYWRDNSYCGWTA